MRVAFLYNRAREDPSQVGEDDVPSRSPVVAALRRLGHKVAPIACTLDLARVRRRLERVKPDVAFNRVESLGGSDAMIGAVTMLFDTMCIPYTGCGTEAFVATASKIAAKERLVEARLPTPEWISADRVRSKATEIGEVPGKYIVKSVYEHASFAMGDGSIVGPAPRAEIMARIQRRTAETGRPHFAERFVDGREFNVSMIGDQPTVLPVAEIDFSAFPAGKPRIVGHGAKWDDGSFEFQNTPRRFDFPADDEPLIDRIRELAVECWRLFGLRGFARVDFRCDASGQPWILEVNANPCLAPSAGFTAALERAGIRYDEGLQRILAVALPDENRSASSRASRQPLAAC